MNKLLVDVLMMVAELISALKLIKHKLLQHYKRPIHSLQFTTYSTVLHGENQLKKYTLEHVTKLAIYKKEKITQKYKKKQNK